MSSGYHNTYNRYSSSYCSHMLSLQMVSSHDAWYFNEMPASVKMASSIILYFVECGPSDRGGVVHSVML